MSKPDAWMPWYIGDYLADTMHLTRDQHGGYDLLLMAYWRNAGPLPDDDAAFAIITKATPAEWRKLRPVLVRFFRVEGGCWHQKRADEELARAANKQARAAAGGRGKAATKQDASSDQAAIEQVLAECSTGAPLPSPSPSKHPSDALEGERASAPPAPNPDPGSDPGPVPEFLVDKARGTRLADDWEPGEALISWAQRETPTIDWRAQTDQFRDYWKAQPGAKGRKADWPATWRGWMRRQLEFQGKPNGTQANRPDQTALRREGFARALGLTGEPAADR